MELDEVPVFRDHIPPGCLLVPDIDLANTLQSDRAPLKTFTWSNLQGLWLPKTQSARLRARMACPCARHPC